MLHDQGCIDEVKAIYQPPDPLSDARHAISNIKACMRNSGFFDYLWYVQNACD